MPVRSINLRTAAALVAGACLLGLTRSADAQTNSLFGDRGPFSQSLSAGSFGGAGGGIGGTSPTGAAGTGASALPGTGAAGTAGSTGTAGVGQTGQAGSALGQGFVGRSDNAGRFVGNAQAAQQTGQGLNFGEFFSGRGNAGADFNRSAGNGQQVRTPIRPRQRIAFDYPQRENESIATSLSQQLRTISLRQPELSGVVVQLDSDGVAHLTGSVASESARRLASAIVRLEPGVRSVVDDGLEVASDE